MSVIDSIEFGFITAGRIKYSSKGQVFVGESFKFEILNNRK